MKNTDVAVRETANGRTALSRDRMICSEGFLTRRFLDVICGRGVRVVSREFGSTSIEAGSHRDRLQVPIVVAIAEHVAQRDRPAPSVDSGAAWAEASESFEPIRPLR
jgi:hypothetical protein